MPRLGGRNPPPFPTGRYESRLTPSTPRAHELPRLSSINDGVVGRRERMKPSYDETIEDFPAVELLGRRALLTQAVAAGAGIGALGLFASGGGAQAAQTPQQPEAETGRSYPMPKPNARTEIDFRMGVIGPAMLSLVTSQLAVDRARNAQAKVNCAKRSP